MDSLYLSYKIGPNDIKIDFTKYISSTDGKRITPDRAVQIISEWADEIFELDLDGNFDSVK